MKISIIGTGYVGLITGACLAHHGCDVTCVDNDTRKVEEIGAGISPIYEPGLDRLLKDGLHSGNLSVTSDLRGAVRDTEVSIIAVGTPFVNGRTDLRYVQNVAEEIGTALADKNTYHVVVVKSTVPPGTTDDVVLPILEAKSGKRAGVDFGVAMNPEFLREGCAVADFMDPDRIVIGGIDARAIDSLWRLYSAIFPGTDIVRTGNRTAELIKYTSNSLLATLISFSNEIANICSITPGVDVNNVLEGVHLDRRFNPIQDGRRVNPGMLSYLRAGCGFGGSCFPKDVRSLVEYAKQNGVESKILSSTIEVNLSQPSRMVDLVRRTFPDLAGVRVTVLGLAFKPDTNDVRESPAFPIIQELERCRCRVTVYDPVVTEREVVGMFSTAVTIADGLRAAISGCDAVLLVTSWEMFRTVPDLLADMENPPVVIDGRRMLKADEVRKYEGIGMG